MWIRSSDKLTWTKSCTVTGLSCTVAISTLIAAPYNLVAGSSVVATVLAENVGGRSIFSPEGNGAVFVAPSVPAAPTTAISGTTNVLITWVAPAQGNTLITEYSVAIRQSDGVNYTAYSGCTGTAISCTVANTVLKAPPYNLLAGSSVVA